MLNICKSESKAKSSLGTKERKKERKAESERERKESYKKKDFEHKDRWWNRTSDSQHIERTRGVCYIEPRNEEPINNDVVTEKKI